MHVKHYLALCVTALKFHYNKKHQRDQQKSKVDILGRSTAVRLVGGARAWVGGQQWFCHGAGCDNRSGKQRLGYGGTW